MLTFFPFNVGDDVFLRECMFCIFNVYFQKGFVKAFSESPLSFTAGFCHVERVMKSLYVRNLFLWPRFHAAVLATHEKHKVSRKTVTQRKRSPPIVHRIHATQTNEL